MGCQWEAPAGAQVELPKALMLTPPLAPSNTHRSQYSRLPLLRASPHVTYPWCTNLVCLLQT